MFEKLLSQVKANPEIVKKVLAGVGAVVGATIVAVIAAKRQSDEGYDGEDFPTEESETSSSYMAE